MAYSLVLNSTDVTHMLSKVLTSVVFTVYSFILMAAVVDLM